MTRWSFSVYAGDEAGIVCDVTPTRNAKTVVLVSLTHLRIAADHPLAAVVLTNVATALGFLWIISEGRPVQYVYRKVFQAALSVVPASIIDAEMEKVKANIEHSVIGTSMQGEATTDRLPEDGGCLAVRRDAPSCAAFTGGTSTQA